MDRLSQLYDQSEEEFLALYRECLSLPSISADPAYKEGVLACAEWMQRFLEKMGCQTERWETPGYPAIYGEIPGKGPTLLLYGHYDVQPIDPLDQWKNPPFEPTLIKEKIYARGAQDNKGQLLSTLWALYILKKEGKKPPFQIKILVEGEEENRSQGLMAILKEKQKELQADYCVIPDVEIPSLKEPTITLGVRGMAALTVTLSSSSHDLHSGSHGGVVHNPARLLARLVADLHDAQGRVTLPGFYEGLIPLSREEEQALAIEINPQLYRESMGRDPISVEEGYSPGQANRLRPTLEINGIHSGYGGPGCKTIIPASALVKISCRLVPGQDPNQILEKLGEYFRSHTPKECILSIVNHGGAPALRSSPLSPLAQTLQKIYSDVLKAPCSLTLSGASIPVAAELAAISGAESAFMGLGLPSDQIHAPNEHFSLDRLRLNFLTFSRFLEEFQGATS